MNKNMCGIAISRNPGMVKKISHRGTEINEVQVGTYWVGHTRLAIQTQEGHTAGSQPVALSGVNAGRYLAYNGEVYNYPRGAFWTDTEYITELLNHKRLEEALEDMNTWDGMWAIALVGDGCIQLVTDPLGKKQLYYHEITGEACSEITPLVRPSEPLDDFYRSEIAKWGYNWDNRTPYRHIKRVMPNEVVRIINLRRGNPTILRMCQGWYNWNQGLTDNTPLEIIRRMTEEQRLQKLGEVLRESVKRRLLQRDRKISLLLSGGLDSTIILNILSHMKTDVEAYTLRGPELQYAREAADYYKKPLRVCEQDAKDAPSLDEEVAEVLRWNETPIDLGSLLPQHRLCKEAQGTIILTGDGADELFGGYSRQDYYDSQLSDIFQELPFYHLPRLDRASMRFTKELRSPFLGFDVVKVALCMPWPERRHKACLKKLYGDSLPESVLSRSKFPLKHEGLVQNPMAWRMWLMDSFYAHAKTPQI